ncbi:hypothetical protein D3C76_790080 [compost metagenome]
MGAAAHGATVHFRQGEGRALRGDDDVGRAGDADAAAEHEAVHRDDHRHRATMHGLEGFVVAAVDRDDALRMLVQLLDIDAGAEAATLGADDDDPRLRIGAQGVDAVGQGLPLDAVEGVDRRLVDHEFDDAIVGLGGECAAHVALLQGSATG